MKLQASRSLKKGNKRCRMLSSRKLLKTTKTRNKQTLRKTQKKGLKNGKLTSKAIQVIMVKSINSSTTKTQENKDRTSSPRWVKEEKEEAEEKIEEEDSRIEEDKNLITSEEVVEAVEEEEVTEADEEEVTEADEAVKESEEGDSMNVDVEVAVAAEEEEEEVSKEETTEAAMTEVDITMPQGKARKWPKQNVQERFQG